MGNKYATLHVTYISANELSGISSESNVYAVTSIYYKRHNDQTQTTRVLKEGGYEPLKFILDEGRSLRNRYTLVVKIKAGRLFLDKKLGEIRVPIKELLESTKVAKNEGKTMRTVSYPARNPLGEQNGAVSFSYRFGGKFSTYPQQKMVAMGEKPVVVNKSRNVGDLDI